MQRGERKPPLPPCKNIFDKEKCNARPSCIWNDAENRCEDKKGSNILEESPGAAGGRLTTREEQSRRSQTNTRQKEKSVAPEERSNIFSLFGGTKRNIDFDLDKEDSDDETPKKPKRFYYFIF